MKDYTSADPVFSETIEIIEATDPGHADNVNVATKQLLQNTLALALVFDGEYIEESFLEVFTHVQLSDDDDDDGGGNGGDSGDDDSDAMSAEDVNNAVATEWAGESSEDETAMSAEDVDNAVSAEWTGESSEDETAMSAGDVSDATGTAGT